MRRLLNYLTICLLLLSHLGFAQYSEKVYDWNMNAYEKHTYSNYGYDLPYRLLKPQNFNPSVKYPLVVMLHGKGEGIGQPCTNLNGLNYCNLSWGANMHLDSINKYPSFVIFPQSRGGDWENAITQQLLIELMEHMFRNYPIDLDRVYGHGISGGARGLWVLSYKFPGLFAALSPHSASGDPAKANLLLYTPIWNVQGEIDFIVRPKISALIFDEFRYRGKNPYFTRNELWRAQEWPKINDVKYRPVYSVIPGESHVSWPHLYNSPTWLNWLYSQNRNKIQVAGRTHLSPGETTRLGIAPGFEAYEWSNGATGNEIVVRKAGTFRVRYKRKQYYFRGTSEWSAWSEPVTITYGADVKPEVSAGKDVVVFLPDENAAQLRGYVAGAGVTYNWTKLSGPSSVSGPTNLLDLNLNTLKAGTYTYRFICTDMWGNVVSDDANIYVIDKNAPKRIAGLTLVNTDNGSDIMKINNGTVIHLGSLPTKNLNIRVDTEPVLPLGSLVTMTYDGKSTTDTLFAYTVFGDANGLYKKGTLATGTHTLNVELKYSGVVLENKNFNFSVVNSLLKLASEENYGTLAEDEVRVFPNPVISSLHLQFKDDQELVSINVYDQMGSLIRTYNMETSIKEFVLDLQELPTGMYRVNINSDKLKNKYYSVMKR